MACELSNSSLLMSNQSQNYDHKSIEFFCSFLKYYRWARYYFPLLFSYLQRSFGNFHLYYMPFVLTYTSKYKLTIMRLRLNKARCFVIARSQVLFSDLVTEFQQSRLIDLNNYEVFSCSTAYQIGTNFLLNSPKRAATRPIFQIENWAINEKFLFVNGIFWKLF